MLKDDCGLFVSKDWILQAVEAASDYLCDRNKLCRYYPLDMDVHADETSPDIYNTQIDVPSLMLNDSVEYTGRSQAGELRYTRYEQIGRALLTRLGCSEEEAAPVTDNAIGLRC